TFERFIQKNFLFYLNAYTQILNAERVLTHQLEYVFYIHHWGIAPTLSFPLMLAPLNVDDSPEAVKAKINLVARYIETF
ncbi:hypothetical protein OFN54_38885, partial [Escherichia coli]|nr:hypothetical protein [Escherichia coli]